MFDEALPIFYKRKELDMTFAEFLKENYDMTEEQYEALDVYTHCIIRTEYDAYIDSLIH